MGPNDAPEPSGESRRLAQPRQLQVRVNERFLRDVFGPMKITEIRKGVSVGHILEPPHDLSERVQITGPRPFDQRPKLFLVNFVHTEEGLLPGKSRLYRQIIPRLGNDHGYRPEGSRVRPRLPAHLGDILVGGHRAGITKNALPLTTDTAGLRACAVLKELDHYWSAVR
jgi:hypothetical protein